MKSILYEYVKNMYLLNKIDASRLKAFAYAGKITLEEADEILALKPKEGESSG